MTTDTDTIEVDVSALARRAAALERTNRLAAQLIEHLREEFPVSASALRSDSPGSVVRQFYSQHREGMDEMVLRTVARWLRRPFMDYSEAAAELREVITRRAHSVALAAVEAHGLEATGDDDDGAL